MVTCKIYDTRIVRDISLNKSIPKMIRRLIFFIKVFVGVILIGKQRIFTVNLFIFFKEKRFVKSSEKILIPF